MDVFVARQPILDRKQALYAYELLFRPTQEALAAGPIDKDKASEHVIAASLGTIGLPDLIGDSLAFINMTRSVLLSDLNALLPKHASVLEILEDVPADEEVVAAVKRLRNEGFIIALDDFIPEGPRMALVEHAHIIKLDVLDVPFETLTAQVEALKPFRLRLLAERVETMEVFEFCRDLGFELFQGYFFAKPNIVARKEVDHNAVAHMRLLSLLNDPEAQFTEIEKLVRQDVTLSYKLLRYVNSASVGLKRPVDSLQTALVMLGQSNIRRWATLVLFCAAGASRPTELVTTALVRARICELVAPKLKSRPDPAIAFTVGLFSLLDALLSQPMDEALKGLKLAPEVVEALTAGTGPLGDLLGLAVASERADWEDLQKREKALGLAPDAVVTASKAALTFASAIKSQAS